MSKVWQIAAGDPGKDRDYTWVFLRFSLACIGSGSLGHYGVKSDKYWSGWQTNKRVGMIRDFHDAEDGDRIILKRGLGELVAVGEIKGEYEWDEQLADVEGWDLQHKRTVDWRVSPDGEGRQTDGGFSRSTFCGVDSSQILDLAEKIWQTGTPPKEQAHLGGKSEDLGRDDFQQDLVDEGLGAVEADRVAATIWQLRSLARWYARHHDDVGEHEIRTFLIAPLIKALGWPEQQVGIERKQEGGRGKIDMVLYDGPYVKDNRPRPVVLIESKMLTHGLGGGALHQAIEYAKQSPGVRQIVVTDGIRYKLFDYAGDVDVDDSRPAAYANLGRLQRGNPIFPGIPGAGKLLKSLLQVTSTRADSD